MSKRSFSIFVAGALVAGVFATAPAGAQAASEVKFFLHSTGCSAADTNFDYLSVVDSDDAIECFYTGSGIRNEIGQNVAATPVTANRETATRYWDNTDGGPITLDATRPVTGEIYTQGGACVIGGAPCSPAGASAGQVILDITLVGKVGDQEIELGAQTDSFTTVPAGPHKTVVEIQPDATLTGTTFDVIELRTWIHGVSVGHGVVKTNGSASSFISIPTASTEVVEEKKTKPAKKKKKKRPQAPSAFVGGARIAY